jgi:GNAT superfamily N-acetyltransferase
LFLKIILICRVVISSFNSMKIRKFHREDAPQVSRVIRKAPLEVNSTDYPEKVIRFMCDLFTPRNLIDISHRRDMYVVVHNNKVLAMGSLRGNEIMTVFVDPRFQGKGIGTKVMDFLELIEAKRGHRSIKLSSSITAHTFYRKRGYRDVRVNLDEDYGKTIIMRKNLLVTRAKKNIRRRA